MFDKNILTFDPGWNSDAQPLEKFTDVRELQRQLEERGVELVSEADVASTGPASLVMSIRTATRFCWINTYRQSGGL
jgi:hypothetical protein